MMNVDNLILSLVFDRIKPNWININ